jgi:hypothetical protein
MREGAMKAFFICIVVISSVAVAFSQEKIESNIDYAYQNAKKGIYWALANLPEKKSKLDENLVADDRLYSSVKLYKEVNGVKIESTGYYITNEVTITIYISNDSLEEYGYLKVPEEEEKK